MAVVQYRNSVQRTKEAVLSEDLFRMRDAIDQYYADKAKYPASLDVLVTDGYLRLVPEGPDHQFDGDVADGALRAGPRQPHRGPRHRRRQERGPEGTSIDGRPYAEF